MYMRADNEAPKAAGEWRFAIPEDAASESLLAEFSLFYYITKPEKKKFCAEQNRRRRAHG